MEVESRSSLESRESLESLESAAPQASLAGGMKRLPSLPLEIWRLIFEQIKHRPWITKDRRVLNHPDEFLNGRSTLHHASLACRLLNQLATPLLYVEVVFLSQTPGQPRSREGWVDSYVLFFRTLYSGRPVLRSMVQRICCAITFCADDQSLDGGARNIAIQERFSSSWQRIHPTIGQPTDTIGSVVGRLAGVAALRPRAAHRARHPNGGHLFGAILLLTPLLQGLQLASPEQHVYYHAATETNDVRSRSHEYETLNSIVEAAMADRSLGISALQELTSLDIFVHPFDLAPWAWPGLCPILLKAPKLAYLEVSHVLCGNETWVYVPRDRRFRDLRLLNMTVDERPSPPLLNLAPGLCSLTMTFADFKLRLGTMPSLAAWVRWEDWLMPDFLRRCASTLIHLDVRAARIMPAPASGPRAPHVAIKELKELRQLKTLHIDMCMLVGGGMDGLAEKSLGEHLPPSLEVLKLEEVWHGHRASTVVDHASYARELFDMLERFAKASYRNIPSLRRVALRHYSSICCSDDEGINRPKFGQLSDIFWQNGLEFALVAGSAWGMGSPMDINWKTSGSQQCPIV